MKQGMIRHEGGQVKMTQKPFLKKSAWENTVYIMTTAPFNAHGEMQEKQRTHAFKKPGLKQALQEPSHWRGGGGSRVGGRPPLCHGVKKVLMRIHVKYGA